MVERCPKCSKVVYDDIRAIQCDNCNFWYHLKCSQLTNKMYNYFSRTGDLWLCRLCLDEVFPFNKLSKSELLKLSFNSNTVCLCSNLISKSRLESLPCFVVDSLDVFNNIPTLNNIDSEVCLPYSNNFNYYSSHEFHSNADILNSFSKDSFSILHWNLRSLSANFDNFTDLLSDLNQPFSVIGISETRLIQDKDQIINTRLEGYQFISQPTLSNAGGVGLYIQHNIPFTQREKDSKSTRDYEGLWIEIDNNKRKNIVCGIIYRHPDSNLDCFLEYIYNVVESIHRENKLCVIMGDFNINLLNFESHPATEQFINTLGTYFFQPHILKPSRITHHSATLIDNIFLNSAEHQTISGNILDDTSDHLPNFLVINRLSIQSSKTKYFKRDYSKFNQNIFLDDISAIDWNDILPQTDNVDEIFTSFYNNINTIIDKHVPLKQLSKREVKFRSKPWISKGIRTSIKKKNKLYNKFLKTNSSFYKSQYKTYRNKISNLIRISKKNYYKVYFNENANNIKNTWKGIKDIITLRPKNAKTPTKLVVDNTTLSDTRNIANAFNDYFSKIGDQLANSIPETHRSPFDYLTPTPNNSFYLFPVTTREIEEEINNLNPKKASGPYSIPTDLLKLLKTYLSKPLELLFNLSFSKGVVPSKFKIARVIPVHKKGSYEQLNNYRPISLLSIFNRLLEKVMYKRLISYVEKLNILSENQFGFRSNHSTVHALIMIVDKIQQAIEEGKYSCGVFLDLSKAFDTVNHTILIKKLEYYGIRGVAKDWFSSYLTNRKQFVSIGNIVSDDRPISCGVPQGSVLGPLLFLIYINDIKNCSSVLDFHLFADDTNLFYSNKSLSVLEHIVNAQLDYISIWLACNKLSLNIDKTNFTIFHTPQKKKTYNLKIYISNKARKLEKHIKYLGVYIDSHLNWKHHIQQTSKKVSRGIGILSKISHFVNTKILKQLYYTLIFPFLTYGILVWGNTYISNLRPLIVLQKKAVRVITFSDFLAHSSPLFRKMGILKLVDLVYFNNAVLMHDYFTSKLPCVFRGFFTKVNRKHSYNTRLASKQSYYLPQVKTNYGKFSLRYNGAKIWNSIADDHKHFSADLFKKKIKTDLLNSY